MTESAVEKRAVHPSLGEDTDTTSRIRTASANFWREFFYWWTEHCPPFVRLSRPFFLFFALRFSESLRDGPTANARRILGSDADDAQIEALRRAMVQNAYHSIYELGRAVRQR